MEARGTVCLAATIGILGCATTIQPLSRVPDDVAQFVEQRQTCDHLRGEEPYSAQRKADLEAAIEKNCRGSDRELASLRSKYRGNTAILRTLEQYENDVEAK